jgi:hypothetical protein
MESHEIQVKITRAIITYLLDRPESGDTIEGIIEWWISSDLREIEIEMTAGILRTLVEKGYLRIRNLKGLKPIYQLNVDNIAEARSFLTSQ